MRARRAWIFRVFGIGGKGSLVAFVVSGLLVIGQWVAVSAFIIPRQGTLDFVRLHYTATVGVDWMGDWWMLFIFPMLGTVILITNAYLSGILMKSRINASGVLHVATTGMEVVLGIITMTALLLNV